MIRLRIVELNFTIQKDWLFKLVDDEKNEYFIMNQLFYERNNLLNCITKKELDYYDKGYTVNASVKQIDQKKVVIQVF